MPAAWKLILAFALLYVIWGTTYLAIKIGVVEEHLPPFLFGGARIGSAGVILLGLQLCMGGTLSFSRRDALGILAGSVFLFILGNGLITIALQTVPSGESAVLAATTTLWIAIFGMFFAGGDRLKPLGWLGIFVGLLGVIVLESPQLHAHGVDFIVQPGPWLNLASAACWGIGTVLIRHARVRCPRLTAAGWQMVLGGGAMLLIGFARGEQFPDRITPSIAAVFCYLLVMGSLIAYMAFQWLLEHVSAPKVGTYAYVNPLVAVLLGTLMYQEAITLSLIGGMLLILMGVFLVRGGDEPVTIQPRVIDDAVTPADEVA